MDMSRSRSAKIDSYMFSHLIMTMSSLWRSPDTQFLLSILSMQFRSCSSLVDVSNVLTYFLKTLSMDSAPSSSAGKCPLYMGINEFLAQLCFLLPHLGRHIDSFCRIWYILSMPELGECYDTPVAMDWFSSSSDCFFRIICVAANRKCHFRLQFVGF